LLIDRSPKCPEEMDWTTYYPAYVIRDEGKQEQEQTAPPAEGLSHDQQDAPSKDNTSTKISKPVEIADIGCGFGGLLFALAPRLPDSLILGEPPDVFIPVHSN
jgi:tRNA (guanine-N7-)-methyltransferase